MSMPVVDIREMRMFVHDRHMTMQMIMRLTTIPIRIMGMLVMLVMHVAMCMLHRSMPMIVLMVFSQM